MTYVWWSDWVEQTMNDPLTKDMTVPPRRYNHILTPDNKIGNIQAGNRDAYPQLTDKIFIGEYHFVVLKQIRPLPGEG